MSSEGRVQSSEFHASRGALLGAVAHTALVWVCVFCLGGAGAEAAKTEEKKSAAEWVKLLGSDKFAEREAATKGLIALGESAEPLVKKALEEPDSEVRRRAAQVLAALTPVNFAGDFVRIGSESLTADGRPELASNEAGTSKLTVDASGLVFLHQNYGSMKIDQTYSFAKDAKLDVKGKSELKLTWTQISQLENYFPDSGNPHLTFENTPNGARVTFEATDTNGTGVKMLFARQADVDKDPALKAALKQRAQETE